MSDSRFRADLKIELYENVRFNDKINELQDDVRHNRRQRLKNRADERQDHLFVQQDSRERFCRAAYELRVENQSSLQVKQSVVLFKAIFESLIRNVN
jgi:hypothetical protein